MNSERSKAAIEKGCMCYSSVPCDLHDLLATGTNQKEVERVINNLEFRLNSSTPTSTTEEDSPEVQQLNKEEYTAC